MDYQIMEKKDLISLLKAQPKELLYSIFEDLYISSDSSPLTEQESNDLQQATDEYNLGDTVSISI